MGIMKNGKQPCSYIITNRPRGVLYVGVASDLPKRIWQHKQGQGSAFTAKYRLYKLVWYQLHETMEGAITHEKRLKFWKRAWKIKLIEKTNPTWRDMYPTLF